MKFIYIKNKNFILFANMKMKKRSLSSYNFNLFDYNKQEIISNILSNIKFTNEKLKSNFSQITVKEELNQIKKNFIPTEKSNQKIELGQIEYKSNYNNLFNDDIKYGILSNIRDSFNYRVEKINDKIDNVYKNIEKIKDKLNINQKKSIYKIKQDNLYKNIISNEEKNTLITQSDNLSTNNEEIINNNNNIQNNINYNNNYIPSLKLNPHIYINKKINISDKNNCISKSASKGSLITTYSEKKNKKMKNINEKINKKKNIYKYNNIELMSTDRKIKNK